MFNRSDKQLMKRHIPVLSKEVIAHLPEKLNYYFDGTLGHGGHTENILSYLETNNKSRFEKIKVVGVDRDPAILARAQDNLKGFGDKVNYVHNSYGNIDQIADELKISKFDLLLLDIGVNLEHFEDPKRGFSINGDEELDMRYDMANGISAKEFINTSPKHEIVQMLINYGDFSDNSAEYIAKNIIETRKSTKIITSNDLKNLIVKLGFGIKKTKVLFQCIRIQVNQELKQLEKFLELLPKYVNINGKCQIITYHSIEDRIVKNRFKQLAKQEGFQLINKHVIKPSYEEVKLNKAARSGKLRIIQYLQNISKP